MWFERLSAYRIMWVMLQFDLPTTSDEDRRHYTVFRKKLLTEGFTMFQYSVYVRHCMSREAAHAIIERVKKILPPYGNVCIFTITDKQFGMIEIFHNNSPASGPPPPDQLMLF